MRIKDLIENLQGYDPEMPIAYALWQPDDVGAWLEDRHTGIKLPMSVVSEILAQTQRKHDATVGLNWEVLGWHIEDVCGRHGIDLT